MAGINNVVVYRKNYMAILPNDFEKVIAVYRCGWRYVEDNWTVRKWMITNNIDPNATPETYSIFMKPDTPKVIVFSGRYSKYWLIRKLQQLQEWYKPVSYKIVYYTDKKQAA